MTAFCYFIKVQENLYEYETIVSNCTVAQLIAHFHVVWISHYKGYNLTQGKHTI